MADLPEFVDDRFPIGISFGAISSPEFNTTIVATQGGFEQRVANWEDSRRRFRVGHELKTQTELDELIDFFMAMRGRAVGFRFRDWMDYSTDMPNTIGTAAQQADPLSLPPDGTMTHQVITSSAVTSVTDYQLVKRYAVPGGTELVREITKPVPAAVRLYIDDVLQTEGVDYTLDDSTGIATILAALSGGEEISWDGLYDVPCRFNADEMPASIIHFNTHNWEGIEIVELRVAGTLENP